MLDRDEESTAHWKRYAIAHTKLYPYLASLAADAVTDGTPLFRHTWLEFPEDPEAAGLSYQYMLGDALLVAPVLDEGATEVRLWLPAGTWVDFWTGEQVTGGAWIDAAAPMEDIPVYVRAGSLIPQLHDVPDTLADATAEGVTTLEDVDAEHDLLVFPGRETRRELTDGTVITLSDGALPEDWNISRARLNGATILGCSDDEEINCVDDETVRARGSDIAVQLTPELTVHIVGPERTWHVRVLGAP